MLGVPLQPERQPAIDELVDALRVFTVESDVFVDVFARAHGLGRTDLNAIMWISTGIASGSPVTLGELAQRLSLSPPATTALVDRLESAGHVVRTRDGQDRRRVTVAMQDAALRLAAAFFMPLGQRMNDAAAPYSVQELALTAAVVRRLTDAVTAAREAAEGDTAPNRR
jgi:DNA-binding MarR family transcriptional regulator